MRFVTYIADEKFMKSMVKLVTRAEKKGGRENLEASDKVLELLQSWGETFECIKKAVEEKFLIHGKGNPLNDFMMKNDSNPK